jgi:ribosomal protein S12 methylthiotransferase accessory factor
VKRQDWMANLFARAASSLLADQPGQADPQADSDVRSLLEALGYAAATATDGHEAEAKTRQRGQLLNAASLFLRVFELAAPDAPGLVSLGAQFDPAMADPMHAGCPAVGVSGVGLSLQDAFQGCIGEGIEYLSQLQTGDDILVSPGPRDPAAALGPQTREFLAAFSAHRWRVDTELSWYRATRITDGEKVLLPADLCLRRPPARQEIKPPFALSTGSAAGTSWDDAALHGLLELIERDAAALWWRGGRRGKLIPAGHEAQHAAQARLSRLRQDVAARRSWLLDITTDIGVPCAVAISCKNDSSGFAFGLAARPTLTAAACSAVVEMCQLELAYAVVEAKHREGGETALNERDRLHRRRATAIDADRCLLLQPVAEPVVHLATEAADANAVVRLIATRLEQLGIETFGVDLTRPRLAVPAARIIAPGLQLEPSELITPRLAAAIMQTGGGGWYTSGVVLI